MHYTRLHTTYSTLSYALTYFLKVLRSLKWADSRALVMILVSSSCVATCLMHNLPFNTHSLMKLKSISTYFFLEWSTRCLEITPTTWLSENNIEEYGRAMPNSLSNFYNHKISATIKAKDLNSALVENLETILCFLELHDTKEFSKKMNHIPMFLMLSIHEAQSVSCAHYLRYEVYVFVKLAWYHL